LVIKHDVTTAVAKTVNQAISFLEHEQTAFLQDCERATDNPEAKRLNEASRLHISREVKTLKELKETTTKSPAHEIAARIAVKFSLALGGLASRDTLLAGIRKGDAFDKLFRELKRRSQSILHELERLGRKRDEIDLRKWEKRRYKDFVREAIREMTHGKVADWFGLSPAQRRNVAVQELKLGGDIAAGYEDFEVTGAVFEKLIEPTLIQPTFVTHLPKELVPLAKLSPDDPTTVEVFELCINGQEIAPGYTEQNNPIEQRERLEHQAGGEQQKLDEDFLVALEHGMPPAGGIGIGIDRLCMMLLGQESIRDVILFPQLKPK
jgi:tRNA synthetases class II (D, K and N)